MNRRYRVGVIGHTGRGNYGHGLDRVWKDLPECEVVAVADADPPGLAAAIQRLGGVRGYADYRQMLDQSDLDLVAIAPRYLDQHREMAVAAAERGIHIYMEKPFCRSLNEADEIVAACEGSGAKLAIAHQTRWSPKLQVARDLLAGGAIGRVLEVRGRGKEDRRGGGEDLWVLGSHVMNLIHTLLGEAEWCFASVSQDGRPMVPADVAEGNEGIGPLAGDALHAMYGLEQGVTAFFDSQQNGAGGGPGGARPGMRFGLQIFGSDGVLEILTGHLPAMHILQDPNWSPGRSGKSWVAVSSEGIGRPEPLQDGGLHGGNVLACRDLIAAIEEDRQPECNVYEARQTVQMIAAVFESHRQGRPVSFPLENRMNPLEAWSSVPEAPGPADREN